MVFVYVALSVLALGLAYFAISVMIARNTPPEVTGFRYLLKSLKAMNIVIPNELAIELVQSSIKTTMFANRLKGRSKTNFLADITRVLDVDAYMISEWLRNPNDSIFQSDPELTTLLTKYLPHV